MPGTGVVVAFWWLDAPPAMHEDVVGQEIAFRPPAEVGTFGVWLDQVAPPSVLLAMKPVWPKLLPLMKQVVVPGVQEAPSQK